MYILIFQKKRLLILRTIRAFVKIFIFPDEKLFSKTSGHHFILCQIIWCSHWFCTPPPSFEAMTCFICGCRRMAFARYWIICFVLLIKILFHWYVYYDIFYVELFSHWKGVCWWPLCHKCFQSSHFNTIHVKSDFLLLKAILRLFIYKALYLGSKTTMTTGEWSCLISFAWDPLTCSERRGGSEKFKMKIYVSSGIRTHASPRHD